MNTLILLVVVGWFSVLLVEDDLLLLVVDVFILGTNENKSAVENSSRCTREDDAGSGVSFIEI